MALEALNRFVELHTPTVAYCTPSPSRGSRPSTTRVHSPQPSKHALDKADCGVALPGPRLAAYGSC